MGANPLVNTPGCAACFADYFFEGRDANYLDIPQPDILIIPDGSFSDDRPSPLDAWVEKNIHTWPEMLLVRVGPQAPSDQTKPLALEAVPPERLLRAISGADLAMCLVEQLAGKIARVKAEEMVEYRGRDPFLAAPPPPTCSHGGFKIRGERKLIKLGIFLFEGFEMLDTFGPMAAFVAATNIYSQQNPEAKAPLFQFTFYAERKDVHSSRGPRFHADQLLSAEGKDDFPQLDWLLIPGGIGTLTERYNHVGQTWTQSAVARAKRVLTVCSGSGYLADLGLLDGGRATTNKLVYDLIASWGPKVHWQPEARWVHDRKFWTSSGVAAGTDQALAVLEEAFGSSDLVRAAAHRMGWHHRIADGNQDCFVAKRASRIEVFAINFLLRALCSWLPLSWRPGPATIDKYLA